jgi:hypothetical protein
VLDVDEMVPFPAGRIHDTATPGAGFPASVTWTSAWTDVATMAVLFVKVVSMAMFKPPVEVDVPGDGEDEGDVESCEQAAAAQRATTSNG